MNNWYILTECYVDTLLVEVISPQKKGYNHQKGCNNVLKQMTRFANVAVLSLIDADKIIRNFENFSLLKEYNKRLSIHKHNNRPHYIIKIGKAVEDFILQNAQKSNVSLADYNLPADLSGLKKITKHIDFLKSSELNFKNLFSALKQNKSSDFHKLAHWIELFKKDPYNMNTELL